MERILNDFSLWKWCFGSLVIRVIAGFFSLFFNFFKSLGQTAQLVRS